MNEIVELILHTEDALMAIVADNANHAYLIVFLLIFCESGIIFTPFLPGDILLFSAGLVALYAKLNIVLLVSLLLLAAIAGNLINYAYGRFFGKALEKSQNKFIQKYIIKYIGQAKVFYAKHGGKSIILGRFFPVIRTYVPFFAGIAGVNFRLFLLYTLIGAFVWIPLFTLTGYFIGNIVWVKNNFEYLILGIILLTWMPLFVNFFKSMRSKIKLRFSKYSTTDL